jgi:hypothetical protein
MEAGRLTFDLTRYADGLFAARTLEPWQTSARVTESPLAAARLRSLVWYAWLV